MPASTTYTTTPNLDVWNQLFGVTQAAQREANVGRIPGAANLEAQSSADIAALLNPPTVFGDVSRMAAEVGAGRGISGSEAAFGTGLRMTDEERLRRMQLGQQMLSAAYARNPSAALPDLSYAGLTPEEAGSLNLRQQAQDLARDRWEWERNRLEQPSFTMTGGIPGLGQGRTLTGNQAAVPGSFSVPGAPSAPSAPADEEYETYTGAPANLISRSGYGGAGGAGMAGTLTASMLTPDVLRQLATTGSVGASSLPGYNANDPWYTDPEGVMLGFYDEQQNPDVMGPGWQEGEIVGFGPTQETWEQLMGYGGLVPESDTSVEAGYYLGE